MGRYILKRLLLILPTLFLILLANFVIVQAAPGGPVEQQLALIEQGAKDNALGGSIGAGSACLLYTSPSPRDKRQSRMPSSA